jgi:hypothetical protein
VTDGITFEIKNQDVAVLEDTTANERTSNKHRVKLDITVYKRLMEQALREQVEFLVEQENYRDKIKPSIERMMDIVVKSVHGRMDKLVADEVERLVKERVSAMVAELPIKVQVNVGSHL